jgi:hypothetical protein
LFFHNPIQQPGKTTPSFNMHDFEGSTASPLLSVSTDAQADQDEFRLLRALNQELTSELFQTCCEIQRDPSSLHPLELSTLVYTLQLISGRIRQLQDSIAPPN